MPVVRCTVLIGHTRLCRGPDFVLRQATVAVNVVCLTGRLMQPSSADPIRPGWAIRLLEVPRAGPGDTEQAGVVDVLLALPPALASEASERYEAGCLVAVSGMLDVDIDYSHEVPRAHHTVIAERIERLPVAAEPRDAHLF